MSRKVEQGRKYASREVEESEEEEDSEEEEEEEEEEDSDDEEEEDSEEDEEEDEDEDEDSEEDEDEDEDSEEDEDEDEDEEEDSEEDEDGRYDMFSSVRNKSNAVKIDSSGVSLKPPQTPVSVSKQAIQPPRSSLGGSKQTTKDSPLEQIAQNPFVLPIIKDPTLSGNLDEDLKPFASEPGEDFKIRQQITETIAKPPYNLNVREALIAGRLWCLKARYPGTTFSPEVERELARISALAK